jgi:hypothetical protein
MKPMMHYEHLEQAIADLKVENERLRRALDAVQALIDESQGVCGLHLNGDIATWDELLQGGRFEGWLLDFSIARAALKGE